MATLFHYCSSSTFTSIIKNKEIWLSSLTLSNDSMEGKILAETFNRIFEKNKHDDESLMQLKKAVSFMEEMFDGLGFCLSENGDLLSQWRGYADDAQGFCIGFSSEYLKILAENRDQQKSGFFLQKVLYNPSDQETALLPTYNEIKADIDSGKLKYPVRSSILGLDTNNEKHQQILKEYNTNLQKVWFKIMKASLNLFSLKNPAFTEEKEWRLISFLGKDLKEDECLFRSSQDRLIPYRVFELKALTIEPITEVIIGPKNITPIFVVEQMMRLNGYNNVNVKRSSASYR